MSALLKLHEQRQFTLCFVANFFRMSRLHQALNFHEHLVNAVPLPPSLCHGIMNSFAFLISSILQTMKLRCVKTFASKQRVVGVPTAQPVDDPDMATWHVFATVWLYKIRGFPSLPITCTVPQLILQSACLRPSLLFLHSPQLLFSV